MTTANRPAALPASQLPASPDNPITAPAGAGTFFGSKTNYAVDGQITDKVPGDPVKGQTLRATISPLEQGQTNSGTLEAERKG